MKYTTVEDVMARFTHPILPTVQGEPDYQTIHATRKFLQANSREIDTHLGGGTLGHLGLIISDASYAMIAPTTATGPKLWTTPQSPGRAPAKTDGTAAQISAALHIWEEDVQTYRTCTSVQQALKKQIISVFEPMYLDILNDNMVGYANISARDMLDHLFETYCNITAVDLEINFEHMRRAWDPQQPVESLFKQIQDCADHSEAGGVLIGHPQQINVGYAKIFTTGHFTSACRRWNEKHAIGKTWTQFKSHFAAAHRQHKQMQVESAATTPIADEPTPYTDLGTQTHLVYAVLIDQGQLYTDLTGKFPVRSSKGNSYVMVCYVYDCNYIKVIPVKSRSASEWVKAYDTIHQELTVKGFKPKLQTLDNEASAALKNFFTANDVEYQLVPPHYHRRNAAERAIRTFK
jgi:hypothetical protein